MVNADSERTCSEFRQTVRDRRAFLRAGCLGAAGLSLAELLRCESISASPQRDRSVIILWMRGGPSHIDMWDPKPDAPQEIRGEFSTIDTNVPGIQLTDMLDRKSTRLNSSHT